MLLKGCLFPTLTERSQLAHARAHTHTHTHPVNESLVCRVTLSLSLSLLHQSSYSDRKWRCVTSCCARPVMTSCLKRVSDKRAQEDFSSQSH